MTSGVLVQILFDLLLLAAVAFLWVKLHRPQKDDPRLSRGLQLLQSKIAVLEDLSDQIETQVQQIMALMDSKGREMQNHLAAADKQILKIGQSMEKSLDVAKIFQDRIPHQEIIERQNTMKYVKAARMAHQGKSLEEIAQEVDLSRGELEMIAKVNRDQLQFSEEDLPEWVRSEDALDSSSEIQSSKEDLNRAGLDTQALTRTHDKADISLSSLGEKFRQAIPRVDQEYVIAPKNTAVPHIEMPAKSTVASRVAANLAAGQAAAAANNSSLAKQTAQANRGAANSSPVVNSSRLGGAASSSRTQTTTGKSVEVQKVVFPRIDMTQHLS